MGVVVFIIIVVVLVLIFSGNSSSPKRTYTPPKQPDFDFNVYLAEQDFDKAREKSEEGNFQDAIYYYNQAISKKQKGIYYNNRAHCKSKINDYNGAIEDYNKAIQLEPSDAVYWANRGMTYYNNDKKELAIRDWRKASQLGSANAKKWLEEVTETTPPTIPVRRQVTTNPNEATLNQLGISYLYHMTHKNNLENILRNGLLSHTQAHGGLNQVDIADNQVNIRRGRRETIHNRSIHDYIPLYFNPKNPMLFKLRNIQDDVLILAIDRNLILNQNSIFTDGNAASQGTRFFNSIGQLTQLNWRCIRAEFWNDIADGKRIRCAEVLVFPRIEIASIKKIYSNNSTVTAFASSKARNFRHITVEQNNNLYFL